MGLDNPLHIAFLLLVLLLVFGAKRLPEMGRSLGSGLRGFRESVSAGEPSPGLSAEPARLVEAGAGVDSAASVRASAVAGGGVADPGLVARSPG